MLNEVECGILRGRPFGGIMCLVGNNLRHSTQCIFSSDRYAVVRVLNFLIINVYFPCAGSLNRIENCTELLSEIDSWCARYPTCDLLIAGDFNVDLDGSDAVSVMINSFLTTQSAKRCDEILSYAKTATYVNDTLGHYSTIDYIATSSPLQLLDFAVLTPDINYSDHLPIMATFHLNQAQFCGNTNDRFGKESQVQTMQFRWDKSDIMSYYYNTGSLLQPILTYLDGIISAKLNLSVHDITVAIDDSFSNLVDILIRCAHSFVPHTRKSF